MANRFRDKVVEENLDVLEQEEIAAAPEPVEEPEEPAEAPAPRAAAKKGPGKKAQKIGRGIASVIGGEVFRNKAVRRQIPLMILILCYFIITISNRYRVEDLSKEKIAATERINYLREHRIQMQKQYQESVKISQIAEDLDSLGIGLIAGPPYELNGNKQ